MKPLTFSTQIDYYLDVVSCRYSLAESLKPVIEPYKSGNILDCSVGTGFGIIELIKSGYNIICSDACKEMLNRFNKNTQYEKIQTSPLQIEWEQLGNKLPESFDLVLCRGNSIVYSNMWDSQKTTDSLEDVVSSIEGIYKSIKKGGSLYIDIPSDEYFNLTTPMIIHHKERNINCLPVRVREEIICDHEKRKRKWDVDISIAGDNYKFTRFSHLIYEDCFKDILKSVGFKRIEKVEESRYRGHYCEFIAYK